LPASVPADALRREDLERRLAPVLADPPATGLLIFDVAPKSQADRADFEVGDVITHYDGQPVVSLAELSRIAREAAKSDRSRLLVLARRGEQELEAEFDAAPLGVRLIPIKQGQPRVLWRPATNYQPDGAGIERRLGHPHEWQLVFHGDHVIGWAHSYLTRDDSQLVLRTQTQVKEGELDSKRDATIVFDADKYLSIRWLQISGDGASQMRLTRRSDELVGDRAGVPVSAPAPDDVVSSFLAGLVATTLPFKPGSCLRSSYLGPGSISSAPFADLYCVGQETVTIDDRKVSAVRYEQTVFGEPTANFWVDRNRDLLQIEYVAQLRAIRCRQEDVARHFPSYANVFPPIERLPPRQPVPPAQAN
jgi:hypothetical protein